MNRLAPRWPDAKMGGVRPLVLWVLVAAACGCGGPPEPPAPAVTGTISVPPGATGDAFLFLYRPGEGPPARPALPEQATAVSAARLASGDPHFVFAGAPAREHRLWGFLDQDRSVQLDVDVLAQPSAGDLTARGVELPAVSPYEVPEPLALEVSTPFDPPAFELPGAGAFVVLPDQPLLPVRFTIRTTRLSGRLRQVAFAFSLVDRDGDGQPDDADEDGQADLYPRIAFRFLHRPGQTAGDALLPLFIESEPAVRVALGGDPAPILPLDQLTLDMLPFAVDSGGNQLPAIPVGEYQLVVLEASGQVWTLPNGLAGSEPSQGIRFFVQHAVLASGLP